MSVLLYLKVRRFAKMNGFNGLRYLKKWENYKVYEPYMSLKNVSYIGLPQLVLVNKQKEVHMATSNEIEKILFDYRKPF